MAQNDFKAFGTSFGANVMSQDDWEALDALYNGFESGKAASAQVNKALRQGTSMAAVLGQYIADYSGEDALDDGDTDRLLASLPLAIRASLRLNNLNYFVDGGAANQLVITPQPAITTLVDGQSFDIACAAANTGAVTLQVSDLPAYPLLGSAGALQGGEIGAAKGVIRVIWSASKTAFLLVAQNSSGPLAVAPALNSHQAPQLGQVLQVGNNLAEIAAAGSAAQASARLNMGVSTATTAQAGLIKLAVETGTSDSVVMTQNAVTSAIASIQPLGVAQTWQNMAASRSSGVTYTNSTGRPIFICVAETSDGVKTLKVDGIQVGYVGGSDSDSTMSAVVPDGSTYLFTGHYGYWAELR